MTANQNDAALVVISDGQPVLCEDLLKLINSEQRNDRDLRSSLKKSTLSDPIPVRILMPPGSDQLIAEQPKRRRSPTPSTVTKRRPGSSLAISDIAATFSKSKSNLSIDSALGPSRRRSTAAWPLAVPSVTLSTNDDECAANATAAISRSSTNLRAPQQLLQPTGRNASFSCNLPTGGRWSTTLPGGQDPTDAIYEVSNDYIKLIGCRRQFINLLSSQSKAPPSTMKSGDLPPAITDSKEGGVNRQLLDGVPTVLYSHVQLPPQQDSHQSCHHYLPKRRSAYGVLWKDKGNWRMRLKRRKKLFHHRNTICDLCFLFALCGIVVAILDAELTANGVLSKAGAMSNVLRCFIILSTAVLLFLIVCYHATEVQILVNDSETQDWRVAITWRRVLTASLELAVCAVCPLPGTISINWAVLNQNHRSVEVIQVPLDVLLSLPMFLRFYLVCRMMALHSRQFRDAATRSIAALNHISVNFAFVLKTLMHENPLWVLVIFTISFWVTMAWILSQCERQNTRQDLINYPNSIWFIIITFMSIGYGDVTPHTYCGRALAISTGIVGAGVSSALIAVISRKLELSRSEKHVNNFMADSKLTRERKHAAAAVLQHTWFIHKYRCLRLPRDEFKLRYHQKRFLASINEFQRIKWEQRKVAEESNALVDVAKLQNEMHELLFDMQRRQEYLVARVEMLVQKVHMIESAVLPRPPCIAQETFSGL